MMSPPAPIRVLFFSALRGAAGGLAESTVDPTALPPSPTVADLLAALELRHPPLAAWRDRLLVAVDLEFATPATPVRPGQEVALMPPVQGG